MPRALSLSLLQGAEPNGPIIPRRFLRFVRLGLLAVRPLGSRERLGMSKLPVV